MLVRSVHWESSLCAILLVSCLLVGSHPTTQKREPSSGQTDRDSGQIDINTPAEIAVAPAEFKSPYVRFSTTKPTLSPEQLQPTRDNYLSRVNYYRRRRRSSAASTGTSSSASGNAGNSTNSHNNSRRRQSAVRQVRQPSCASISQWVEKETVEDINRNRVAVSQNIRVGDTRVRQYFFETFCAIENCQCLGVDERRYESRCQTTYIFAYANTIDEHGTAGWNQVKLRGSCTCSIHEKQQASPLLSLWDL